MYRSRQALVFFLILVSGLVLAAPAHAQVNPLKKAQKEAEKALKKATDDVIRCTLDDEECIEDAEKDGKDVVIVDDEGNPIEDPQERPEDEDDTAEYEVPGEGVWRNYDFVPGNMQIVELDGQKVLEASENSTFRVILPEALPEDFTLELTLKTGTPNMATNVFFTPRETAWGSYESQYIVLNRNPGIYSKGLDYNLALSDRRAASVVVYLVERGIDAGRLQKVGKDESDPVVDNTTEAGRQQNRRVVIRLQGQE